MAGTLLGRIEDLRSEAREALVACARHHLHTNAMDIYYIENSAALEPEEIEARPGYREEVARAERVLSALERTS